MIHAPYKECSHIILAVPDCSFNRKFTLTVCGEDHAGIAVDQELRKRDVVLSGSNVQRSVVEEISHSC